MCTADSPASRRGCAAAPYQLQPARACRARPGAVPRQRPNCKLPSACSSHGGDLVRPATPTPWCLPLGTGNGARAQPTTTPSTTPLRCTSTSLPARPRPSRAPANPPAHPLTRPPARPPSTVPARPLPLPKVDQTHLSPLQSSGIAVASPQRVLQWQRCAAESLPLLVRIDTRQRATEAGAAPRPLGGRA